jgi:hypothetical protein
MTRTRLLSLLRLLAVPAVALALGACGGDSASTNTPKAAASVTKPAGGTPAPAFQWVLASSEQVVGPNRFALGLIDGQTQNPLPDAKVHFRFFELQGSQGTLRFESDAVFRAPAREAGLATAVEHRHLDGTIHVHSNAEADVGVYTAQVTFDKPGQWGVQAQFTTKDGRPGEVQAGFEVLATSKVPMVGQPAPRSHQPTIHDVKDISEIDSSAQPDPRLHDTTIADAIATGKPTLVLFATPGYCSSRFCGPSVEIIEKMMPKYAGKVNFIHVEVYKDFTKLTPSDTFTEWHLASEPWFFIIDGQGTIASRFDGPTTMEELDAALANVLS